MKVKFNFDSELCWHTERVVDLEPRLSDADIKAYFPIVLGVTYDEKHCYYEILNPSEDEMLSYTE